VSNISLLAAEDLWLKIAHLSIVSVGEPMSYIIVFMTASTNEEAVKIVRALLEERLIACAHIMDPVSSFFWWQGKIEEEKEVLVIMKSHESLFKKLSQRVAELHSYEVPEILALPIIEGSPSYLDWMKDCLEPVK
jgi:periplasmic divalent cation tolerance protein